MGGKGRGCLQNVQYKVAGAHNSLETDGGSVYAIYQQLGDKEKADVHQKKTALYVVFAWLSSQHMTSLKYSESVGAYLAEQQKLAVFFGEGEQLHTQVHICGKIALSRMKVLSIDRILVCTRAAAAM